MSALQQNISGTNIHRFSFINILPLTLHATALCLSASLCSSHSSKTVCDKVKCFYNSRLYTVQHLEMSCDS